MLRDLSVPLRVSSARRLPLQILGLLNMTLIVLFRNTLGEFRGIATPPTFPVHMKRTYVVRNAIMTNVGRSVSEDEVLIPKYGVPHKGLSSLFVQQNMPLSQALPDIFSLFRVF